MKSLQRHMVMVKHVWHTWFSQISCDQKLRINQRSHRSAWRFTGSQSFPVASVIISYCCVTYCDLTWQIVLRLCYGFHKRQYILSSDFYMFISIALKFLDWQILLEIQQSPICPVGNAKWNKYHRNYFLLWINMLWKNQNIFYN